MTYRFACSLFAYGLMSTTATAALAQAPAARPAAQPVTRASFIATMDGEYKKLDANNDGVVTRVELETSQQRTRAAELAQQARLMFVKFDTDKNGQLSLNEFIYATSGGPQQRPDVAPMMTRLDSNRDQKVTLVEYRTVTLTGFDRMDSDKDGVVSVAEMRAGGLVR